MHQARRIGSRRIGYTLLTVAAFVGVAGADKAHTVPPQSVGTSAAPEYPSGQSDAGQPSSAVWQQVPAKVRRYARKVLQRHDVDASGRLESQEWIELSIDSDTPDVDRNGVLTAEELVRFLARYGRERRIRITIASVGGYDMTQQGTHDHRSDVTGNPGSAGTTAEVQESAGAVETASRPRRTRQPLAASETGPSALAGAASHVDGVADDGTSRRERKFFVPSSRLPDGLPEWFLQRDSDGDGQLTLAEFAPRAGNVDAARFAALDLNGDGLVTAAEGSRASKSPESTSAAETDDGPR